MWESKGIKLGVTPESGQNSTALLDGRAPGHLRCKKIEKSQAYIYFSLTG